jgi:hypothetical protein
MQVEEHGHMIDIQEPNIDDHHQLIELEQQKPAQPIMHANVEM